MRARRKSATLIKGVDFPDGVKKKFMENGALKMSTPCTPDCLQDSEVDAITAQMEEEAWKEKE
eukprot:jgi/Psemu1/9698/gm1.9698_g